MAIRYSAVLISRSKLLAGAATMTALMMGSAHAEVMQEASTNLEAEADMAGANDIVVTGEIMTAQAESIALKRAAANVMDVAAADAVGRFPDQNSAAALSRLPAVAVQRDQGQERYIQVRGAPNRWTSVSLDGVPVIGVDEGGSSRAYRFDAIPAVLLSSLAVNKSLTADLQAESIVANIDLRTYSPMDQRGFSLQGDIAYGPMELGGGFQQQGSLRASWSNDTWGFVIGGSHYRRDQVTDNREVTFYDEKEGPNDTAYGPTELDIRSYHLRRENNSAFVGVDFVPMDGLKLAAKGIFTEFKDAETRDQYEFRLDRAASGTRNLQGGELNGVPVRATLSQGEYKTRNYIGALSADYEMDDWKANAVFNYARTENTTWLPLIQASTSGLNSPSIIFDYSNPRLPTIELYETLAGNVRGDRLTSFDQTRFGAASLIPMQQDNFSDSYTFKADVERVMGAVTLKAGMLYADRAMKGFVFSQGQYRSSVPELNVNNYVTDRPWDTGFPLGFAFNYVDNHRLREDIDAYIAAGGINLDNNVPDVNRYNIKERTLAAYVSGKFEFDGGQVLAGVRMERMHIANKGAVLLANGNFNHLNIKQSYTDFFPSLNAKFDISNNVVFRVGAQRAISRPAFGAIRVSSSISDVGQTISGGNPLLNPEYTWGIDSSLEFYLPGEGIISVGAFHRWVDDVLYDDQRPVGSDIYNSDGIDRSDYLIAGSYNGKKGKLYGLEINFQQPFIFLPSPFDGLGFQGNLTLIGGSFDTPNRQNVRYPGASDRIANASLYYEKYGFTARVSYQHRTDWFDTLGGLGSGSQDSWRGGYNNVDVALRYAINPNFTVFADLSNLTDSKYTAYQGHVGQPTEVEQVGRRYMFGVRFSM